MVSRKLFPSFRRLASNRNGPIVGHIFRVSRHQPVASVFGSVVCSRSPSLGFFTVSTPEAMIVSLGPHLPELRLYAAHAPR